MKKIPFNLQDWLSDKSQKVVTADGRPVEILKTNMPGELPLLVLYDGNDVERVSTDGKYQIDYDGMNDLFLVTEEPELTEFEKAVFKAIQGKEYSKEVCDTLLTIARKQLKAEGWEYTDPLFKKVCEEKLKQEPIPDDIAKCIQDHWWEMLDSNPSDAKTKKQRIPSLALTKIVENLTPERLEKTKKEMEEVVNYDKEMADLCDGTMSLTSKDIAKHFYNLGKSEALKDLPKWKIANEKESLKERCIVLHKPNDLWCSNYAEEGEYYIPFSELEKLPKE